mmetsp:Transcript_11896/g.18886  ORF Transcript_11896/g.18886 Transcript_11896/m.18886 type:complete len:279 (+) Transcript_11896:11-847(+)
MRGRLSLYVTLAVVLCGREAAAFSGGGALLAISRQQHHRTGLSTLRCQGPGGDAHVNVPLNRTPVNREQFNRARALRELSLVVSTVFAAAAPTAAQRPPPRPKVSSVPIECKQAGGCAMDDDMNPGMPKFESAGGTSEILDTKNGKYSTGLKVQIISEGDEEGSEVGPSSFVQCQYVLRRANGYFVDASYGFERLDTFDFKMGKGKVIAGFEEALKGMHPGARRRFVVPPELGYVKGVGNDKPGPMPPGWGEKRALDSHRREPLVFEVQVVKVKNRDE